ncbi:STAS domain-containing protein [Spirilliplanes yamanashiensis]|uniref:Anti-sigma factor antagonist n=1 Tax=Spirilliplanes yamanashiensis TaxID=42233 RepID=A0A8J3YBK6_9ACTN|nr:STAS domain-containing protein [Spirilliplanes yamanashiensis]MDP9819114.1 anti-anti-sigma factor [Spirilliplanes yamanashiensis]GIJ05568.1 hypothetical protein Sya03_49200 [Spirilliplanes yamanashiensis]
MTSINGRWSHRICRDGATATVALSGELDMTADPALTALLTAELDHPGTEEVRADLHAVTFIDSWTISTLVRTYRAAHAGGRRFVVTQPHGHVRRVLDVAGVLATLTAPPA